jgi:ectoine hydroxylase-related dioxygenase (phytanoyl-CoA dioxygenase family)
MKLAMFDAKKSQLDNLTSVLDEEGYVILRDAVDFMAVRQLHKELEPHFYRRANSKAHFFGFNTKRIEALFSKSVVCQHMATSDLVLPLVNHILREHCDHIQINLTQGIRINPGEKAQIIHPDSAMFPLPNKPFEFMVNALWAYSAFKKENGATLIVPGSHKWQEGRQPNPNEIMYAEMPPGSVLIYAGSLLHAGGANVTDEPRTGITISYSLGWLRQSENQYLSYPLDVVRTFDPALQNLLGYNVHKPNLGWVFGHSPVDLITGENKDNLGAEDFLTDTQQVLLAEYHSGAQVAVTSHDLKS